MMDEIESDALALGHKTPTHLSNEMGKLEASVVELLNKIRLNVYCSSQNSLNQVTGSSHSLPRYTDFDASNRSADVTPSLLATNAHRDPMDHSDALSAPRLQYKSHQEREEKRKEFENLADQLQKPESEETGSQEDDYDEVDAGPMEDDGSRQVSQSAHDVSSFLYSVRCFVCWHLRMSPFSCYVSNVCTFVYCSHWLFHAVCERGTAISFSLSFLRICMFVCTPLPSSLAHILFPNL